MILRVPVFKFYQPVYGKGANGNDVTRECTDRWAAIEPALAGKKGAVLDIGCNIGYFSFKTAEHPELSVVGIEASDFNITCCNAIRHTRKVPNVLFVKKLIDPDFVRTMPSFGVIYNLSVFHHWVKAYGEDAAKQMMKDLANHCETMIFETGQPDERGTKWCEKLTFMGEDPKAWIANFLKEIGFTKVEIIGTFSTGLTDVDRYLYLANKR